MHLPVYAQKIGRECKNLFKRFERDKEVRLVEEETGKMKANIVREKCKKDMREWVRLKGEQEKGKQVGSSRVSYCFINLCLKASNVCAS